MNQVRFRIKAGSAARQAEQAQPESSSDPRSLRIAGGAAARLSEEDRRTDPQPRAAGSPTLSMRAQGGRVFRTPAEMDRATSPRMEHPAAPQVSAADASLPATTGGEVSSQPGLLRTAADRVSSLFHTLFHPGKPAQGRDKDATL